MKFELNEKNCEIYFKLASELTPVRALMLLENLSALLDSGSLLESEKEALLKAGALIEANGKLEVAECLKKNEKMSELAKKRWEKDASRNASPLQCEPAAMRASHCGEAAEAADCKTPGQSGICEPPGNEKEKVGALLFNLLKTKAKYISTREDKLEQESNVLNKEDKFKELNISSLQEENKNESKTKNETTEQFVESEEELRQKLKEVGLEEHEEIALYLFRLRKKRAKLSKIAEEVMAILDHPCGLKAFREVKNVNGFKPVNYILAVADRIQKNAEKARTRKARDDIQEKAKQIWLPADKQEALNFIERMQAKGIYNEELAEALRRRVEQ